MHARAPTVRRPPHAYRATARRRRPCTHSAPRYNDHAATQPPCDGYQGPKPLRDDDDAGTQPTSSSSRKGSTEPPRGDEADTEHLRNGEKVGAVPPRGDDAPTEPDYDVGTAPSR